MSTTAPSFAALNNDVVTTAHEAYCTENGHATYRKDGVVQDWCPRCGLTTEFYAESTESNREDQATTPHTHGDDCALIHIVSLDTALFWGCYDGQLRHQFDPDHGLHALTETAMARWRGLTP